jgi:hypothetical protein
MTSWTLLPALVVRSTGFPWETIERLAHRRSARAADSLLDLCDEADRLRAELPAGLRLTRGQLARLRSHRPLPPGCPAPADWLRRWNTVTEAIAAARERLSAAAAEDEREAAASFAALVADPRFLDAVACSGPGVFRDIVKGRLASARLRRQVASYAQRLATKCETMSFFGPINHGVIQAGLKASAVLSWQGHQECAARRAYLSAWAFDQVQAEVLADSRLLSALVPRRKTFASVPAGDTASATLADHADGSRTLAEISARCGLTPGEAARVLTVAVDRGFLTHDLMPPATEIDPVGWLSRQLGARMGEPGKRLEDVIGLLERYPAADAAAKLALQAELGHAGQPAATAADRPKFYNDRLPVTEAAVGTLDLQIGGELARDLAEAVPAVLDLLAHVAMRTRRLTNGNLARTLGPGRFPFTSVLCTCGGLPVAHDSWLRDNIARALASAGAPAGPATTEVDLAGLLPTPPPPELPVLCSVDVMVATAVLAGYRSGCTPLVIGDFHDAPLLTPWALQFHPDAAAVLADRDRQIRHALGGHQAVSVVARRTTGLPPLRFPGPVVEIGPVDEPAERIPLDRLYVLSDGERACLRARCHDGELFLHNGELDTGVHTAFALPRVRPPMLPDTCYLPRLRYGGVVLARSRWRLMPGPLSDAPDWSDSLALRRSLRSAGVPARFFAKASHERKPIYVDTDSPLLMEGLLRLARDAQTLYASELLPGPGQMWLRDGALRFAAELRCVYLRSAGPRGDR